MSRSTFHTSISAFFKGVRTALTRTGVNVGGTASYPRVEIHSISEETPEDKDNRLRSVSATIESISEERLAEAVSLTEGNIERLFGENGFSISGYTLVGVIPGQVRVMSEDYSAEQNKVLYRILQDVTIWLERTPQQTTGNNA